MSHCLSIGNFNVFTIFMNFYDLMKYHSNPYIYVRVSKVTDLLYIHTSPESIFLVGFKFKYIRIQTSNFPGRGLYFTH